MRNKQSALMEVNAHLRQDQVRDRLVDQSQREVHVDLIQLKKHPG